MAGRFTREIVIDGDKAFLMFVKSGDVLFKIMLVSLAILPWPLGWGAVASWLNRNDVHKVNSVILKEIRSR